MFKKYFCCLKKKVTEKEKEINPTLKIGWEEHWDERYGVIFYYNKKTKVSQWDHPGYSIPNE